MTDIKEFYAALGRMSARPYRGGQELFATDRTLISQALRDNPSMVSEAIFVEPTLFLRGISTHIAEFSAIPDVENRIMSAAKGDPLTAVVVFDGAPDSPLRTRVLRECRSDFIRIVGDRQDMAPAERLMIGSVLDMRLDGQIVRNAVGALMNREIRNEQGFQFDLMRASIERNTTDARRPENARERVTETDLSPVERVALEHYFSERPELRAMQPGTSDYYEIPLFKVAIADQVTFDNDGINPEERRWMNALSDIGNGLGHFRVTRMPDLPDGTPAYVLRDYFDFARRNDSTLDNPRGLLLEALAVSDPKTRTDPLSTHPLSEVEVDERNKMLGRIFAPELDDRRPSVNSLPIVIKVEPEGRGGR